MAIPPKIEFVPGDFVSIKSMTDNSMMAGSLISLPTNLKPYWIISDTDGNPTYFGIGVRVSDPKSFIPIIP